MVAACDWVLAQAVSPAQCRIWSSSITACVCFPPWPAWKSSWIFCLMLFFIPFYRMPEVGDWEMVPTSRSSTCTSSLLRSSTDIGLKLQLRIC